MEFLSVRAAAERVGKSTSSIRRLIYPIIKQDNHTDRHLVQPSVEEAMRLRVNGENFPWKVSEELLKRIQVTEASADHSPAPSPGKSSGNGESELLSMLRWELDIKNTQISGMSELLSKQVELVGGLSERLREGNVLIGTLQQRLALTDGREKSNTIVDVKHADKQIPKKGLFGRLFR